MQQVRVPIHELLARALVSVLLVLPATGVPATDEPQTAAPRPETEHQLYPTIEPFETGFLAVSDLHEIYYELSGNRQGEPVMVLHGGPGVGSYPRLRQYFDPDRYLIVLHDQRGAGSSRPSGETRQNTTEDLVQDIEKLRIHLHLDKVVIFGGSWGSTLALAYAETFPHNVRAMVLRGVFTASAEEVHHHYFETRRFFPDAYEEMVAALPEPARGPDPLYLLELIRDGKPEVSARVLDTLNRFEMRMGALQIPEEVIDEIFASYPAEARRPMSIIDLHYVTNAYFLEEGQLLQNAGRIGNVPVTMVNGRYDMLCPPEAAYRLHRLLPGSQLILVGDAGHSEREPGITTALVRVMNELAPVAEASAATEH